jgi:hypothetical protein
MDTPDIEHRFEVVFNPEVYVGKTVDIVHRASLDRVLEGRKPASIETVQDAGRIKKRIAELEAAGIEVRYIDGALVFEHPAIAQPVVIGGAFDGECIAEYVASAREQEVEPIVDPLLSLRLD